jgi:hypothetical protein
MKSISNQVSLLKNVPSPNKNILTTKTKKATRFNKRNLLLHKISPNSPYQQLYTSAKSSLFSDPSNFFSTSFEGKEVIIGKKASPYKIAPITNALTPLTRMARKSILLQANANRLSISKGSISVSNLFGCINLRNPNLQPNQQYVNENDLKKIYDDFKQLHNANATDEKFFQKKSRQKNDINRAITMQEKMLIKVKENEKEKNKIIKHISKKSRRNPDELLFNRINCYRIKKELKNELDKEMKKMYFTSVNDWQLTLRNDPKKMDVNYLNLGSTKRPNWQMIVKNPINDEKEIVRNPSKNEIIHAQKERNTFLKNSYLKEVLPYKSFYLREHDKLDLEIKGKDLLVFEQNNSKLLKRRKILSLFDVNDEMKKSFIYESDSNPIKQKSSSHSKHFSH